MNYDHVTRTVQSAIGGGVEYNSGIARANLAMFGKILYILITYYLQQLTPKSKIPWI